MLCAFKTLEMVYESLEILVICPMDSLSIVKSIVSSFLLLPLLAPLTFHLLIYFSLPLVELLFQGFHREDWTFHPGMLRNFNHGWPLRRVVG